MVEGGYPVIVEHSLGCLMKAAGPEEAIKAYNLEKKAQFSQFLGVDFGGSHWLYFLPVQWQWVTRRLHSMG